MLEVKSLNKELDLELYLLGCWAKDMTDQEIIDSQYDSFDGKKKVETASYYKAKKRLVSRKIEALTKSKVMDNKAKMEFCYETHKFAFENWKEGKPVEYWEEPGGIMCVRYESGEWWHYKQVRSKNIYEGKYGGYEPCLEWW